MTPKQHKLEVAFREQNGKCIWCGKQAVLLSDYPDFESAMIDNGFLPGDHMRRRRMKALAATLERLVPGKMGGNYGWKNVAMAHMTCNSERGHSLQTPSDITLACMSKSRRRIVNRALRTLGEIMEKSEAAA